MSDIMQYIRIMIYQTKMIPNNLFATKYFVTVRNKRKISITHNNNNWMNLSSDK